MTTRRADARLELSPAQQRVVEHRGGDLQVIACAGSGKTESIARRVAALIVEGDEPASVVAFTFTERAASELKDRIVRRIAEVKGPEFRDRLGPMFVGTIHSYCFRVLQDHVPRYGNYDILDENRHAGFLSREYRGLGLARLGQRHWQPIRDFAKTVDIIGNELIRPEQLDGTPLGECYRAYRAMLDRCHFLTYSTLVTCAVEALEDGKVGPRVRLHLRHLLVDEYQDINPAQQRLIELLAQPPVQLCVVGDDDQSIYQWRGSDVNNILNFSKRRAPVAQVVLAENRRSRATIVETANRFAQSIPDRLPKEMVPARSEGSADLTCWTAETDDEEAERIAGSILRLHEHGFRFRDIAVLYRSVRTSGPPLLTALSERDIPFDCGGRTGLFLRPEISLFGEVFAWFVDGEWKDERFGEARPADLHRIVAGLSRHFGHEAEHPALRQYLVDWKTYQRRGIRTVNLVEDFYRLLALLGAGSIDFDTAGGSARFGAFARFSELLADFEHVHRRGHKVELDGRRTFRAGRDRGKQYLWALYNYLLHWARDAYEDFAGEPSVDLDAVAVLTVHQAKGLEWPVVFLPALVEGRFPSRRAGQPQQWALPETVFPDGVRTRYEGGDAEERRLFYVAMTRARDAIYLSTFRRKQRAFSPSRYFRDVAAEHPEAADLPVPELAGTKSLESPTIEVPFSDLARVEECGLLYRLGTVFGFAPFLAPELGYGRAVHHVLRQVAEHSIAHGKLPATTDVDEILDGELYVPFATDAAFAQMRTAALRLVRAYVERYAEDMSRLWAVERPFALHFDEGTVTGRADVILDREGGRQGHLAIVDYKVAHDPLREERYALQLQIYAAAGRGEGLDVDAAYLHELRDGSRIAVEIGDAASTLAVDTARAALLKVREASFEPRPSPARCPTCPYTTICRHACSSS